MNIIPDQTINEGQKLEFTVSGSDPDGDSLTYSAIGLPTGATFNNGIFDWTPNYTQSGTYNIQFTANDGTTTSTPTTAKITVNNVNRPPSMNIIPDQTINEGQKLEFTVSGSYPDGDSLTYSAIGLPTGATFNNGIFDWTPNYTQSGTYNIQFTANDGTTTSTPTTAKITVNNVDNTAPTVIVSPKGGTYNTPQTVTLTAKDDTDPAPVIKYSTDGTTWNTYNGPITINKEGTTTLQYYATDKAR